MERYDHKLVELKWQQVWQREQTFSAPAKPKGEHAYVLDMFPYPSAYGLHVGHVEGYTATDIYSRYLRMKGVNVLHPMGFDAFGLPAENYAIKTGRPPRETTQENVTNIKAQLNKLGFSYDWSREVNTSEPAYYKWTQWLFLQLYKKGLAYRKEAPVNWCPKDQTVLANEQVVDGCCERCGTNVEQRNMKQWFFKTTAYAERLLNELEGLDWPKSIVGVQKNWIGKSEGAEVKFEIRNSKLEIRVFTTRLDTIFGATFIVISPEFAQRWMEDGWQVPAEVKKYVEQSLKGRELDRLERASKEKTGVDTGIKAINPATGEEIPVWVADYVLGSYGTGAIMAVPAHDERDFAFAKKFNLSIKRVVEPKFMAGPGESAIKSGQEVIKRNAVCAVVHNPKNGTYLCVSWKAFPMHGFVTGGVEESEDIVAAAQREIHEETGYKNVRLVRDPKFALHSFFYHRVKKQNLWARFQYLFFELENDERDVVDAEHAALHDVLWKSKAELRTFLSVIEGEFTLNFFDNPDYIHTGDGLLHNSGEFDDLESAEAVPKIAKKIGAELKTQYHLRDWLISRQRYWGAPIPIIYCDNCAKQKPKVLLLHGVYGHAEENWFPWLRSQLEREGCTVFVPQLPNAEAPTPEQWLKALKQLDIKQGDSVYIVAHSLGAPAACHYIQDTGIAVEKLILVAPTGKAQGEENWNNIISACGNSEAVQSIKNFNDIKIYWAKLKKLIKERRIYLSDNDPFIPLAVQDNYNELDATVRIFSNRGHFNRKVGMLSFPEILEELGDMQQSGYVPVLEKDLPIELPDDVDFRPHGESPLGRSKSFHDVKCPKCGAQARRESDTMDTFVDSSWYFLRYCDPQNKKVAFDPKKVAEWCPVNLYVGGAEHAVLHLMYARFITKVLQDMGYISFSEPFLKLRNQGLVLGEDGQKMSKSKGNVVNPDEIVNEFGADTLRMYEMFLGPLEDAKPWNTASISGVRRFLDRVWSLCMSSAPVGGEGANKLPYWIAKTVKKVTDDIEAFRFNTAIAALMEYLNYLGGGSLTPQDQNSARRILLQLLYPFAPHITSELWEKLKFDGQVWEQSWPTYDETALVAEVITIAVQVNGKLRATIGVSPNAIEAEVVAAAKAAPAAAKHITSEPKKIVYVPGKLVSFVIAG